MCECVCTSWTNTVHYIDFTPHQCWPQTFKRKDMFCMQTWLCTFSHFHNPSLSRETFIEWHLFAGTKRHTHCSATTGALPEKISYCGPPPAAHTKKKTPETVQMFCSQWNPWFDARLISCIWKVPWASFTVFFSLSLFEKGFNNLAFFSPPCHPLQLFQMTSKNTVSTHLPLQLSLGLIHWLWYGDEEAGATETEAASVAPVTPCWLTADLVGTVF